MNAADSSKRVFQFYHASSLFLVALTPLAQINPYQSVYVSLPMDMLLGEHCPLRQLNNLIRLKRRSRFASDRYTANALLS